MRAIIFDLDDTLHDKSATLRFVAKRQFADWQIHTLGVDWKEWLTEYVALNNIRIEKAEVFARLRSRFALPIGVSQSLLDDFDSNLGKSAQVYDGGLDLLKACRARDIQVGIVTNGRDAFQRSKIDGMAVSEYVDAIVTSGGFGAKKPDHRIFIECLTQLGVSSSETVLVGDSFTADMEPALALGMRAIWKSDESSPLVAFSSNSLREIHAHLLPAA